MQLNNSTLATQQAATLKAERDKYALQQQKAAAAKKKAAALANSGYLALAKKYWPYLAGAGAIAVFLFLKRK